MGVHVCVSMCVHMCLSVCVSMCVHMCLSVCVSMCVGRYVAEADARTTVKLEDSLCEVAQDRKRGRLRNMCKYGAYCEQKKRKKNTPTLKSEL